ncbi:MAG: hypothetical protein SFY66_20820 [Oculatellaceae cyanobacterium bins.114]|nr:hypothetical protein [Oculatellaceae cyanobacterium bins.114]
MRILGATQFDQCVLNISLINLCNQESYVGQELRKLYKMQQDDTNEPMTTPWLTPHQFTIFVPHPEQEYDGLTLEAGLTKGYNVEIKPIQEHSYVPYDIPPGGHFVVVLKQKSLNDGFNVAATGIFVRSLAVLKLDIIVDMQQANYQPVLVKHPVIRDYPSGWESKLQQFLNREIRSEDLPDLVGYVDQRVNRDYRPPSWHEISLAAKGFAGV